MKKKNGFIWKKLFQKENEEIKKLKNIKKRIRTIKTYEDLDALEEELIAIGVIDKEELEKMKNAKHKKRRKSQKEIFEERIRCNLEIINRTILIGKQFKVQAKQRKDEERRQDKEERSMTGMAKSKNRDEKMRYAKTETKEKRPK